MKVLKFGGTSVGTAESLLNVKTIVENEVRHGEVIAVVSALGGITDQLIGTSQMALKGDKAWRKELCDIIDRHHQLIGNVIADGQQREELTATIDTLFDQLQSILFGVYLVRDLSQKTLDAIVSYGERVSSHIVATLISGAVRMNARNFIRTERKHGRHMLDTELTYRLVREAFQELPRTAIAVVPGFIARDRDTGETTNLGRGGSDYTASVVAAALGAWRFGPTSTDS